MGVWFICLCFWCRWVSFDFVVFVFWFYVAAVFLPMSIDGWVVWMGV